MQNTKDAVWPVIGGAAVGAGFGISGQIYENVKNDQPITNGVGYAATIGAVNGVVTGKFVQLSGGGLAGNAAWQPGIVAAGQGIQLGNPANQQRCDNQR